MDLVKLVDANYAAKVEAEMPLNLCQHMVTYIRQEFFKKNQNLSAPFVKEVLKQVNTILLALPNVITVDRIVQDGTYSNRVTVIGDLHGQFRDLGYLIGPNGPIGFPSINNQIIVNGDMVDRGDMSVEILIILSLITILVPGSVHMLKGNHEAMPYLTESCGFDDEVKLKYPDDPEVRKLFAQFFEALPVAAVVDNAAFVVHGGIGQYTGTIEAINRIINRSEDVLTLYELLWNDPGSRKGMTPHIRGEAFGPDITAAFLKLNNLKLLIRSHECCQEGYQIQHNDLCWTVFSAANYCEFSENKGAVLQFDKPTSCTPSIVQFAAVHYPVEGQKKRRIDTAFTL